MLNTAVSIRPVLSRAPSRNSARTHQRPAAFPTVPFVISITLFLIYTAYALREHDRFGTSGYDLGIFNQAVRSYAEGHLPMSEIRTATAPPGFNAKAYPLLGDHFHPVLAFLAPLYRLAPHVQTLLVAQAALVAVSAYAVARAAQRHLPHQAWTFTIGLSYGLSWGLQQLIGFDFHEVAFGVPVLALAGSAYLDGRWTKAALWAAALLLVKEDLGATVAVFGLVLMRHHRKVGLTLCGLTALATAAIVLLVIPAFAPDGRYGYLTQQCSYGILDGWTAKTATLLALCVITLGLAFRSPFTFLVLPTLFWRLTSSNPAYWGVGLHYSAILMPIVFIALIDVLRRGVRLPLTAPLLVALLLLSVQPLRDLTTAEFWRTDARISAAREAVRMIPRNARVAASNRLSPHLTDRARVYLVADGVLDKVSAVDWIVVDTRETFPAGAAPHVSLQAEEAGWQRVYDREGILVLQRQSP
ncbi:DUF2079 domain-containing protein [Streptomyces chattanoogensis]|uniref:DUF2079 domain-containing protein n=1 Tax=Streptomyces chattanoogensis TaxID=66876 RepID=UPI0036ADD621